ncbi:MAG: hypothetical protein U0031_21620 [Thermomicrobiales bacterium]
MPEVDLVPAISGFVTVEKMGAAAIDFLEIRPVRGDSRQVLAGEVAVAAVAALGWRVARLRATATRYNRSA